MGNSLRKRDRRHARRRSAPMPKLGGIQHVTHERSKSDLGCKAITPETSLQRPSMSMRERYIKTERIARTIFGSLYRGQDRLTGEVVALKCSDATAMRMAHEIKGKCNENPRNEFRIMAYLNSKGGHSNIIPYRGKFLHRREDELCGVFDWVEGYDMFDAISEGLMETNPGTAHHIFRQIASAVGFIHRNGICHLDLSLENLVVSRELDNDGWKVTLLDFGQARMSKKDQFYPGVVAGSRPGKVGYMSPEVFHRQAFNGFESDMYALGIILFVLVSGKPPYLQTKKHGGPYANCRNFRLLYTGRLREVLRSVGVSVARPRQSSSPVDVRSPTASPLCSRSNSNNDMTEIQRHSESDGYLSDDDEIPPPPPGRSDSSETYISPQLFELLEHLLCPPEERWNIEQVLACEWINHF